MRVLLVALASGIGVAVVSLTTRPRPSDPLPREHEHEHEHEHEPEAFLRGRAPGVPASPRVAVQAAESAAPGPVPREPEAPAALVRPARQQRPRPRVRRDRDVAAAAYHRVLALDDAGEALERITRLLETRRPELWYAACEALKALRPASGDHGRLLETLWRAIDDPAHPQRRAAVRAYIHAGDPERDVLPVLRWLLDDADVVFRRTAADQLGKLGYQGHRVAADLRHALGDRDPLVREIAREWLPYARR